MSFCIHDAYYEYENEWLFHSRTTSVCIHDAYYECETYDFVKSVNYSHHEY